MPRRPALIFDLGNVLLFFDPLRTAAALARPLGLSPEAFHSLALERGVGELARRFERGEVEPEAFSRGCCDLVGLSLAHDEFAHAWADIFTVNEPVARLARGLAGRGYTLVIGSNTNVIHADWFRRVFADALAPFQALVLSHEVGRAKPEAAFYQACARAAGAPPIDCVFIDDLPENVQGARAAGLTGLLYRDTASLLIELRASGVEVDGLEV